MTARADSLTDTFIAAVHSAVKGHVGKENALARTALLAKLGQMGYGEPDPKTGRLRVPDRKARLAIEVLQERGELIGSTGGKGGGYFVLRCMAEYRWFEIHELNSRALTILRKRRLMRRAAHAEFDLSQQMEMGL
jgi:hypothetical protein